jgi:hypothetical protein|tara:strand:- start:2343 stop:2699 length:357 start_codon:yes stop_codon:yes gene_type:complete
MLRESSQISKNEIELRDVTAGLTDGTQIPQAELLVGLAETIVARDAPGAAGARDSLQDVLGNDAVVDAVAITSAFHGFVRIADAIGIPYTTAAQGQDAPEVREEAGINDFYRIKEAGY